jgi:hypothetical protein
MEGGMQEKQETRDTEEPQTCVTFNKDPREGSEKERPHKETMAKRRWPPSYQQMRLSQVVT